MAPILELLNVLLVTHTDERQHRLLPQVVAHLREAGVRSRLVHDVEPSSKHRVWTLGLPTVVVSLRQLRRFMPTWATLWQQAPHDKVAEQELLEQAGIPVPAWAAVTQTTTPEVPGFDDYVVVKPARGAVGAMVRIMRREKVRWRPIAVTQSHGIVNETLIVQQYIHTGPWPTSYRVGTVFGEPIYGLRIIADQARPPIVYPSPGDGSPFEGRTIVASSKRCTMDTEVPDDVIALARRAHRVFPTVPLLGIDIVREHATGRLYVLEVNSRGWTFHLTSEMGERLQREFGIDLHRQFGGAAAIARGIVRRLQNPQPWTVDQARVAHETIGEQELSHADR